MHYLIKLFIQRLALGLLTLFVVSLVIFLSIELLPGDVAQQVLGQSATPENLAAFRRELGLDQPAHSRYLEWLGGFLQGDLGNSLISGIPIWDLISERLYNTFFLAGFAALISVPLAVLLGVVAALYRDTLLDKSINVATLTAISVPEFFVGYILVWLFAVELGLFPSIANLSDDASLSDRLYRTFLPALTLTLIVTAHMMRMTRASLINLLALPYIEMARLKGASQRRLIVIHALPNAIAPIVTVIAINLAYLIVGVVIVEVVFVYPGMGQLLVDSVAKRDFTVVQTSCLLFSATYILFNLASDLISIASNPRLLHRK
ncbi:ABC transporter permease [Shimia sp. CNT1-13L.2]|uniref:ABC transporter permease n=1 Tax=Shimia sp. CNT1-13L.2 TaxID=2959663 RepID=UPI0020CD1A8B|nr:ABC transporter permease [Shimia sp. CNT1-13L.2]MCP9483381.1 ABC transporter permease [Shimia sp. CNT1-13L.2]